MNSHRSFGHTSVSALKAIASRSLFPNFTVSFKCFRASKRCSSMRNLPSNKGIGNHGKYSKPAVSKFKRKTKTTKKTNIMYTCNECGKSKYQKKGQRAGKVLQE